MTRNCCTYPPPDTGGGGAVAKGSRRTARAPHLRPPNATATGGSGGAPGRLRFHSDGPSDTPPLRVGRSIRLAAARGQGPRAAPFIINLQ